MRKWASLLTVALAFCIVARAQEAPPARGQDAPKATATQDSKAPSQNVTMTGCIQAGSEAGSFLLADSSGAAKTYSLMAGGNVDLKQHVGHKVEVSGTKVEAKGDGAAKAAGDAIQVTSVKMVAPSCQ